MFGALRNYIGNWSRERQRNVLIKCDNPQCQYPIYGNSVAYSKEHKEVYHDGRCLMFAEAHRMASNPSGAVIIDNVNYISARRAKSLYLRRRLKQARGEAPSQPLLHPN